MSLSFRDVAEILKIIDASDCEELSLEVEGLRMTVRRRGAGPAVAEAAPPRDAARPAAASPSARPAPASPSARPAPAAPAAAAAAAPQAAGAAEGVEGVEVRAPMVGTFFRRPSPGEPAFVEEGARVKAGDPLCLIEVMKLYTTIEAPCDGTILRIAAEDSSLVEFDQPLFVIRQK